MDLLLGCVVAILQNLRQQSADLGSDVVWLETSKTGFKMKIALKLKLPRSVKVFLKSLQKAKNSERSKSEAVIESEFEVNLVVFD